MPKSVLVIDHYGKFYADELNRRVPGADVRYVPPQSEMPSDLAEFGGVVSFPNGTTDDILARMTSLAWAQSLATGVDHYVKSRTLNRNAVVTSTRGIHGPQMSETVIFQMLGLARREPQLTWNQKAHSWDRAAWPLLQGKTAVIVGIGVIGLHLARLLKAFEMTVIGVTRTLRPLENFDRLIATDDLAEAASLADYLINILPGTAENDNLFGREVFAAMKPGAFYVGSGRGHTVDEDALIAALKEKRIAGAAMDAFRQEPLPADSPFWDMPNVFITPHIGGMCREYPQQALPIIEHNLRCFMADRFDEMLNRVER